MGSGYFATENTERRAATMRCYACKSKIENHVNGDGAPQPAQIVPDDGNLPRCR
jgi:hypothetical protein